MAILNAVFTSACTTKPQCGHSNRFRILWPNPPHRLHRFEVYAGLTYITGIPLSCACFSTDRCSVKNESFSKEKINGSERSFGCEYRVEKSRSNLIPEPSDSAKNTICRQIARSADLNFFRSRDLNFLIFQSLPTLNNFVQFFSEWL